MKKSRPFHDYPILAMAEVIERLQQANRLILLGSSRQRVLAKMLEQAYAADSIDEWLKTQIRMDKYPKLFKNGEFRKRVQPQDKPS